MADNPMPTNPSPASPSVSPIAEAPALKPCPWCGSESISVIRDIDDEDSWIVQCNSMVDVCPMMIHVIDAFTRERAIAAWNRRAPASLAQRSDDRRADVPSGEARETRTEWCMDCDGCGWCEGSPAYTCHACKGTGIKP